MKNFFYLCARNQYCTGFWGATFAPGYKKCSTIKTAKNMAKVIKGSATYFDNGDMVFTPYNSDPEKNGLYMTLCTSKFGTVKMSKHKIYLNISLERKGSLLDMKRLMLRDAMELLASMECRKVIDLYAKMKDNLPEDEEEDEGESAKTPNAKIENKE